MLVILHPALSVRLSVGWLVGWLVGWSVSQLYFIFFVLYSLTLLLLPKCSSDLKNDPCLMEAVYPAFFLQRRPFFDAGFGNIYFISKFTSLWYFIMVRSLKTQNYYRKSWNWGPKILPFWTPQDIWLKMTKMSPKKQKNVLAKF